MCRPKVKKIWTLKFQCRDFSKCTYLLMWWQCWIALNKTIFWGMPKGQMYASCGRKFGIDTICFPMFSAVQCITTNLASLILYHLICLCHHLKKKCSYFLCKLARQGFKLVLISRTLEKLETLAVELCKYWVINFMDCFWASCDVNY